MKTKLIILLIAFAVLVSFGAARTTKKSDLHANAETTDGPIGGLAVEDR